MNSELDRRDFLRVVKNTARAVPVTAAIASLPQQIQADPLYSNLEQYLKTIKDEITSYAAEIENNPNSFNLPSDLTGFQINFPFYKAGELSYGTPWLLTFITHRQETTYSNDPNTYNETYSGAMQRSRASWPEYLVDQAAEDWTFLQNLPQRRSDDWKEIIWGAKYLRDHANGITEEDFLRAVYEYCAPGSAEFRVALYRRWKTFFTPGNP